MAKTSFACPRPGLTPLRRVKCQPPPGALWAFARVPCAALRAWPLTVGEVLAAGPGGESLDHVGQMAAAGFGVLADWLCAIHRLQPGLEAWRMPAGTVGLADMGLHPGQRADHARSFAGPARNDDGEPAFPALARSKTRPGDGPGLR